MGPSCMGQLFYCCHLSSRSQRSPRWIGKSKAELLSKERVFPSHSPWQFDCSTWHIPSSGHSGLVDHGYRHILLGTVLIPVETQVSSVLLHQHSDPLFLLQRAIYAYLWAEEVQKGAKVNKILLQHAYRERRHVVASSHSQSASLSQGAALLFL